MSTLRTALHLPIPWALIGRNRSRARVNSADLLSTNLGSMALADVGSALIAGLGPASRDRQDDRRAEPPRML